MDDKSILDAALFCTGSAIKCKFCCFHDLQHCQRNLIGALFDICLRQKEELNSNTNLNETENKKG